MLIDLQLHSFYSDGYLSPSELIRFINKQGVRVAALTDHNTLSGLVEFKKEAKKYSIKVINGLELYTKYKGIKINLLWYNFNEGNENLQKLLKEIQQHRFLNCKKYLKKLKKEGYKINEDKILSNFNDYIPINRLTDKIISNKFNHRLLIKRLKQKSKLKGKYFLPPREEDILGELFFNKKNGKLNESYINAERLLKIKKEVGGQIIFCHPGKSNRLANNMTEKLKKSGIIDGIEVLSPHHSINTVMYVQFLAEKLDLIASGGSDFHRFENMAYSLKSSWEWFKIDSKNLRRIRDIIG
jgi:hypothetical protein